MNRYAWWGYAKSMVRRYPALCAQEAALLREERREDLDARRGDSAAVRGDLDVRAAAMPPVNRRELAAVRYALDALDALPDGGERRRVVELMYLRGSHTLCGAALAVHVSERTARRWHTEFIRAVGRGFGLL